jgi:hypothetical protein
MWGYLPFLTWNISWSSSLSWHGISFYLPLLPWTII